MSTRHRLRATVIKAHSGFFEVRLKDGRTFEASSRKKTRSRESRAPVVLPGDSVEIEIHPDDSCSIEKVFDRKTLIERTDDYRRNRSRPVLANVDYALAVFAADRPKTRVESIDRYLISIEYQCLKTALVFNKWDLADEEAKAKADLYEQAGYRVLRVSVRDEPDRLKSEVLNLDFERLYICGPSGVGKTSITNIMLPNQKGKTGAVSDLRGKGRHTTTSVEFKPLDENRYLADTPGLTRLTLLGMPADNLKNLYREFLTPAENCRYRGCLHHDEPDCAVRDAVGDTISAERYKSYLEFYAEIDEASKNRR